MTRFNPFLTITILRCALVIFAHLSSSSFLQAQEITFRSLDDGVEIAGRFIGYDTENVTVMTQTGVVTFRFDGMVCDAAMCPDLDNYVPELRMIGAPRLVDVLLPALIEVYARDRGWSVEQERAIVSLRDDSGLTRLKIAATTGSQSAAFDIFLNHDADALLSLRELRADELDAGAAAGLGRLDLPRQSRILALDALVPVISPAVETDAIALSDLTDHLAGQSDDYDVHLLSNLDGQFDGFADKFMTPFGIDFAAPDIAHESLSDLVQDVSQAQGALSLVPIGAVRNAAPLALTGPCGLQSSAHYLSIKSEDYPLTFPVFMYLPQRRQHPNIESFLGWMRSPSAQLVIRRAGFVDLAAVPIPLSQQGDRLASAILNAGPQVPLGELQRMIRVLTPRVRMSSTFRFEPGSTRLDGQSRSNIMQLAQSIRNGRFRGQDLMFVGFSDGRGPAMANRDLSSSRAEAVRRDLTRALDGRWPTNVSVQTEAFGEALPMACDDTIWGQQTNRRVELWVGNAP